VLRTRLYRNGNLEASEFDVELVSDYLEEPDTVVWMDLVAPTAKDLDVIAKEFNLHPLALEDTFHPDQRPKIERYEDHFFFVMHAAWLKDGELRMSEVDAFLGRRYIITVRKDPDWSMGPVLRRWDSEGSLLKHGIGAFLHGLLDTIVDEYLIVTRSLTSRLQRVDDAVLEYGRGSTVQQDIYTLRRDLSIFTRVTGPMKELMLDMRREDSLRIEEELIPYFEDVNDHVKRVAEAGESMQDLLVSALNLHLSVASHRLNDIMRKVTSYGAIIGVATTIAGIYGMNFRLFPAGNNPYGFWIANGLIALSALVLFTYFRRKDWL